MRGVRRAAGRLGETGTGKGSGGAGAAGVRVDPSYGDRGMKGAMRAADRSRARIAVVAGDRDIDAGTVGLKDLSTGEQTDVAVGAVVAEVLTRLQP